MPSFIRRRSSLVAVCLFSALVTLCPTVSAQPLTVKLKIIPKGRFVDVDHQKYRAYNLDEFKALLTLDTELFDLRDTAKDLEKAQKLLEEKDQARLQTIHLLEQDLQLATSMAEQNSSDYKDAMRRLIEAQDSASLAWKVAAGCALATATAVSTMWLVGR